MSWRRLGRLVVTLHTADVPNDPEWSEYVSQADAILPLESQRILVVSAGGGPSGAQRKAMVHALDGAQVPVAILTNSLLMRGAGIAISWFNPHLKMFGPDQLQPAIDYLGLTAWERAEVPVALAHLEEELGVSVVTPDRRVA